MTRRADEALVAFAVGPDLRRRPVEWLLAQVQPGKTAVPMVCTTVDVEVLVGTTARRFGSLRVALVALRSLDEAFLVLVREEA